MEDSEDDEEGGGEGERERERGMREEGRGLRGRKEEG